MFFQTINELEFRPIITEMIFSFKSLIATILILIVSCQSPQTDKDKIDVTNEFVTPLGKIFSLAKPSDKMLAQFEKAKKDYEATPANIDNIIWFGRRAAYLGRFVEAIKIYSKGISKYPDEPRLYRHRGHRYISLRKFDEAIEDLEQAGQLIEGTDNEIEPDGMPNALNIPISTLHGNIWYHLGLAYYLKHDYGQAYDAYMKCRESGNNADNIVSSTHWLYMIQKRLGNNELAEQMLMPIEPGATIIENTDYYDLCKFYKGLIPMDSLHLSEEDSPSSDAVKYGLANWYFYNGNKEEARKLFEEMVEGKSWSSFGYIAAESDLIKYFNN